ncbi:MAG TPA: Ger(x)C family spore germination protein [Clostridiales bacterium]|nr:Ger(x)C family spore germination protein [Clostridiales bacterium]
MNREFSTRNSLELYYEHLQVIILSEEVARDGIEDIMDFFGRDPEMRRRVKVFVCPDQAKSILDVQPRIEDYSSIYLAKLLMNADKTSRMVHRSDLGEIINRMHAGYDFLLAAVYATKDEIKTSGAAVFKNRRMVGWINGIEVESIKFMVGTFLGGVIPIRAPDDEDGIITIEVTKAKSSITPIISDDMLKFRIEVNIEANYAEDINMHTHAEIDSKFLERLEDDFSRHIEENCMKTAKRLQEYGADVMMLKRILETKKPEYWEEISNSWEEIYPNARIEVVADVDIMLQGIVR